MKRVLGMLDKGKGKAGENLKQANDIDNDHGMEVDVDIDIATMKRFVRGLTGADAGTYVTMDDIECEEIIRMEDAGGPGAEQRGSSDSDDENDDENESAADEEEEEALKIEEAKFMNNGYLGNLDGDDIEEPDDPAEGSDNDDDEEGEEDDELDDEDDYEESSFQARLHLLRAKSEQDAANGNFDDEDEDDLLERNMTWADKDEVFIQYLDVRCRQFQLAVAYSQHREYWTKRKTFSTPRIGNTSRNCSLPWMITTNI
jgi:hypothetical protein